MENAANRNSNIKFTLPMRKSVCKWVASNLVELLIPFEVKILSDGWREIVVNKNYAQQLLSIVNRVLVHDCYISELCREVARTSKPENVLISQNSITVISPTGEVFIPALVKVEDHKLDGYLASISVTSKNGFIRDDYYLLRLDEIDNGGMSPTTEAHLPIESVVITCNNGEQVSIDPTHWESLESSSILDKLMRLACDNELDQASADVLIQTLNQ